MKLGKLKNIETRLLEKLREASYVKESGKYVNSGRSTWQKKQAQAEEERAIYPWKVRAVFRGICPFCFGEISLNVSRGPPITKKAAYGS